MANATPFRLPSITVTQQDVPVHYPQPDGTSVDGTLSVQYKVLGKSDLDLINKELDKRKDAGEDIGDADLKIAYLSDAIKVIANVVDDNGTPRPSEEAKRMCLDNPITRNALWEGYINMINKSSPTAK